MNIKKIGLIILFFSGIACNSLDAMNDPEMARKMSFWNSVIILNSIYYNAIPHTMLELGQYVAYQASVLSKEIQDDALNLSKEINGSLNLDKKARAALIQRINRQGFNLPKNIAYMAWDQNFCLMLGNSIDFQGNSLSTFVHNQGLLLASQITNQEGAKPLDLIINTIKKSSSHSNPFIKTLALLACAKVVSQGLMLDEAKIIMLNTSQDNTPGIRLAALNLKKSLEREDMWPTPEERYD